MSDLLGRARRTPGMRKGRLWPALPIAVLAVLAGLVPASAQAAAPDCQFGASGDAPLEESISRALRLEPACKKNDAFLFALGQKLNLARLYPEAADRLEGALLLNPDHWAAQLEYAIALEGMGDPLSADGVLRNLLSNRDVDAALKKEIRGLLDKHLVFGLGRKASRTQLGVVGGYDNNLMGGARVSQFDLTLPGGRVPVILADESRPRAGGFARFELSHDGYFEEAGGKVWSYTLTGNYRYSPDYSPANFGLLNLQVERGNAQLEGPYAGGGILQLQTPAGALLRQYQLNLGYDLAAGAAACRFRLAADLQRRVYPQADILGGHYAGGIGYWICPAWGMQVQVRGGQDRPEYDERPGGTQNQYAIRVSKSRPMAAGIVAAEVDYYHQADQRGYSPLLEDNLKRVINRLLYRLEYRTMLSGLSPYAGIEVMEQDSNLPLYRISNRVFYLGIRSVW